MNDKLITEAIHASVAKTILAELDTKARDAILQKSIRASLESYVFRNSVEAVVAEKARQVTVGLVETGEWESKITEAIQEGFADYILNLKAAIPGVIALTLHGKDGGSYEKRAGTILNCWPEKTTSK